jgi:hypothetical protein
MEGKPIQPVRIGLVAQLSLPAIPPPIKIQGDRFGSVVVQIFSAIVKVHETESMGIQRGSCIYAVFKDWHISFCAGTSLLQERALDSKV